ncbi:MAG: DMT family transporter [Dermatophilaceae bacterium]
MSLLLVLGAAFCSGTGVLFQARAAREVPTGDGMDAGLLLRLLRLPEYLLAMVLVAVGFGCAALALRSLPVFLVQSGRAASLAVTAALAALVLGERLHRRDVGAVAATFAGLVLLAVSAVDGAPQRGISAGARLAIPLSVLVVLGLSWWVAQRGRGPLAGVSLATLSGAAFGVLAVAVRGVTSFDPAALSGDPLAWSVPALGVLGLALSAAAFQRASVVAATGALVGTETVLGAVLGVLWEGDSARPGWWWAAAVGFALVLGGAGMLARFGEVPPPVPEHIL